MLCGYYQVEVAEKDKEKTEFILPYNIVDDNAGCDISRCIFIPIDCYYNDGSRVLKLVYTN